MRRHDVRGHTRKSRTHMKTTRMLIALALTGTLALSGCSSPTVDAEAASDAAAISVDAAQFPVTVTDSAGKEVTINKQPERIVLAGMWMPATMMAALGEDRRVVGVSETMHRAGWPGFVHDLPSVGSSPISIEAVLELTPDLVVTNSADEELRTKLESFGIDVLHIRGSQISPLPLEYRTLGRALGVPEAGERAARYIEDRWEELAGALVDLNDGERPRVFFESARPGRGVNALRTFTDVSGSAELLEMAGGTNIAAGLPGTETTPDVSLEWVIEQNPEVIIVGAGSNGPLGWDADLDAADEFYEQIVNRPGFDQIDAVRNGRILLLNSTMITDPLHPAGLYHVAHFLHPEKIAADRAQEIHTEMLGEFFGEEYGGVWEYTK